MALTALSRHCVITGCFVVLMGLIDIVMELAIVYKAEKHEKPETSPDLEYSNEEDFFLAVPKQPDFIDFLKWPYLELSVMAAGTIATIIMITGILKRRVILLMPFYLFIITVVLCTVYYCTVLMMSFCMGDSYIITLYSLGTTVVIYMMFNPFVAVVREIRQEQFAKRKQADRV